jgi:acyl carrier protein
MISEGILAQLNKKVQISRKLKLKEDLGLPSIKLIMLLTELTQKIGISIMDFNDYELLRIKTVGDLENLLTLKQEGLYEND